MKFPRSIPLLSWQRTIPVSVFVFFGVLHAFGQKNEILEFYFEIDTISVTQGQSFLNFLVLKNISNREITISDFAPTEKYPGLLLSTQTNYTLLKGEEKRLPIKFLANPDFMKMKSNNINFQLSYFLNGKKETKNTSFIIDKNEENHIALYSFSRENYINPSMTETTVSIFVENRSYSRRSIKLSFKSQPDELDISPKEQTVSLEAREKKLVEVKVGLRRNSSFFQITIYKWKLQT